MIKLRVTSVTRKTSVICRTINYTYEGKNCTPTNHMGGEWETIELMSVEEDKPAIQVACVIGSAVLTEPARITINDPALFGVFKSGDIVELKHVIQPTLI